MRPWPFDTVALNAVWAPFCGNFVCLQRPAFVGGTATIHESSITLNVYGSDTALPPGVTPQPQIGNNTSSFSTVQVVVGPLAPASYTVTTLFHQVDPTGNYDCPAQTTALKIEQANGPVERLTVVEFYSAAMDHYFMSAEPAEIADLDNGVHRGWSRTGLGFNVFAPSKSGGVGVAVCRFYGLPSAGLDSHFYTSDRNECASIPDNSIPRRW